MSYVKEHYFRRSLAYLGAASRIHRLSHDFEDMQVKAALLQFATELEHAAQTWQTRAETLLEVGEDLPRNSEGIDPEGELATVLPPRSDTEPPSLVPPTLPSERLP